MERDSESRDSEIRGGADASPLFEGVPDPTLVVGAGDGRIVAVNEAATELLGRDESAIVGGSLADLFPDCGDRVRSLVDRTSESGSTTSTRAGGREGLRIVDGDGNRRLVEVSARSVEVDGRDCVGVGLREVGESERRRRILERLQRATDRLVGAASRAEVAAVTAEVAEDTLDAPLYAILLYDPDRDALVDAAASERAEETFSRIDPVGRGEGIVWKAFERDEVLVYGDVRNDPDVYDPDTEVRSEVVVPIGEFGVLVVSSKRVDDLDATDVSTAKTLATSAEAALTRIDREQRLRNQTRKLRTIIENAPVILFALDEDGVFTVSEGRALERIGLEPGDVVGESIFDIYGDHEEVCEAARRALAGEPVEQTTEVGGRMYETWYRPVNVRGAGVSTPDDEVLDASVIGASIDVTERERRERLVRVLNRFLRHNLRNAMNVVVGYAQRLDGHADPEVQTAVDRVAETGSDLTRLSEKARRLSEMAATEREADTVEVGKTVDRIAGEMEDRYGAEVTVRGVEEDALRVPETVELAIREICENAVKHSTDPSVTVSVTSREESGTAVVDVLDDGPGLPDQERLALESEGETPLKHGSGLGLFVAYWAVSDAGGRIDVRKADEEGTGITVSVPLVGD